HRDFRRTADCETGQQLRLRRDESRLPPAGAGRFAGALRIARHLVRDRARRRRAPGVGSAQRGVVRTRPTRIDADLRTRASACGLWRTVRSTAGTTQRPEPHGSAGKSRARGALRFAGARGRAIAVAEARGDRTEQARRDRADAWSWRRASLR